MFKRSFHSNIAGCRDQLAKGWFETSQSIGADETLRYICTFVHFKSKTHQREYARDERCDDRRAIRLTIYPANTTHLYNVYTKLGRLYKPYANVLCLLGTHQRENQREIWDVFPVPRPDCGHAEISAKTGAKTGAMRDKNVTVLRMFELPFALAFAYAGMFWKWLNSGAISRWSVFHFRCTCFTLHMFIYGGTYSVVMIEWARSGVTNTAVIIFKN